VVASQLVAHFVVSVVLQWSGAQSWVTRGHVPAPSQLAASVATSAVQLPLRHDWVVSGYVHVA
jgi:hypothetical protein